MYQSLNYPHDFYEGGKCLKEEIVRQFWTDFEANPTEKKFDELFNSLLKNWVTGSNQVKVEALGNFPQLADPLYSDRTSFQAYFYEVLQIVLYRLIFLNSNDKIEQSVKIRANSSLADVLIAIDKEISLERLVYCASLILHISRNYLEDYEKSIDRGSILINLNQKAVPISRDEIINKPYYVIIEEALKLLKNIYSTDFFKTTVKEFLGEYQFYIDDQKLNDLLKLLICSLNKIVFLDKCYFAGMVGINLRTYLNLTKINEFFNTKSPDQAKKMIMAFVVCTKLHEDAYHLIHIQHNNFLSLTPRKDKQWEAGYAFQFKLFKAVISSYENAENIGDLNVWKQGIPMLSQTEIKIQEAFYTDINFYSSGICTMPVIINFR